MILEQRRDGQRNARMASLERAPIPPDDGTPDGVIDRGFKVSIVRWALLKAQAACGHGESPVTPTLGSGVSRCWVLVGALPSNLPKPDRPDAKADQPPLVKIENLKVHFPIRRRLFKRTVGHVKAVDGVNLSLQPGSITETLILKAASSWDRAMHMASTAAFDDE